MLRYVFIFIAWAAMSCGDASAENRIALVIGISEYESVPALANPINDSITIGAALEQVGFDVVRIENPDYSTLRRSLRRFREKAENADVSLIYFAGHGIEVDRQNYLLPKDARLEHVADIAFEAIPLTMVQQASEASKGLSIVVLDACRNNPFLAQMAGDTRSLRRGLSLVEPQGQNRIVAFAAKEGTVASDGKGSNSPYALALS